jgi:hypothetical protein
MTPRFVHPLILSTAVIFGAAVTACGGSSSETPYPLEPVPHSVKPLKHNESGSGGDAASAPSPEAQPPETSDQN